jgi:hypothetical protein
MNIKEKTIDFFSYLLSQQTLKPVPIIYVQPSIKFSLAKSLFAVTGNDSSPFMAKF